MGRELDYAGRQYWAQELIDERSLDSVVLGFANSPEFQSACGSTTNEKFVTLLYNNVLDRAPDAGGLAY